MKRHRFATPLLLLVVALMAGNVGAQPGWVNPWAQTPYGWGLTPEQTKQIQDIMLQWQTEMTTLRSELQAKNIEFQSLTWQPNPDPDAVATLAKEIGEIQARLQTKSVELRNTIRGVLTEEQQALFDQQGPGTGWARGPCGLGMGLGWNGGFGRGRGFYGGRGRGWSMGTVPGPYGGAFYGRGRGPCGMGMGMAGGPMSPWTNCYRW